MKYVKNLSEYQSKSDRVEGWRPLLKLGLRVPSPIKIVTHEGFLAFRQSSIKTIAKEIISAFKEIRTVNPDRGVYAGRGYFVPDLQAPPGPRSSSIKDENIIVKEVEKLFRFALNNGFDKPGSEINAIMHPFINPVFPLTGGCITPSKSHPDHLVVEAIYGNDEGVQSFYHDTFYVNTKLLSITQKIIQKKPEYLQATDDLKYETRPVPKNSQDVQCLDDLTILTMARDFQKLISALGPHRVEFATQKEGVYFRDCTPFELPKGTDTIAFIETGGAVVRVGNLEEVKQIRHSSQIVYIDPKVITERNMDLLTFAAYNIDHPIVILYPGSASTAHAATILREKGHAIVFVGNRQFETGDRVHISTKGDQLEVQKVVRTQSNLVSESASINELQMKLLGGKSSRIVELEKYHIKTPKYFVITTEAFDYFIEANNLTSHIEALSQEKNRDKVLALSKKLQNAIEKGEIPPDLDSLIANTSKKLCSKSIAVRSSASVEDGKKNSFAGQFDTYLNIPPSKLFPYIKKCWASLYNSSAITYTKYHQIPIYSLKMGVLVMEMIAAKKGGVIFTKDVAQSDKQVCVIEAAKGLGDQVVDGLTEPDKIRLDKHSRKIMSRSLKHVLTDAEIDSLLTEALKIEKIYKSPQDIEWAIDQKGTVFILQSRPITT